MLRGVGPVPLMASMGPGMSLRRSGHAGIVGGGLSHLLLGRRGDGREGEEGAEADGDIFVNHCSSFWKASLPTLVFRTISICHFHAELEMNIVFNRRRQSGINIGAAR
jgi:hypothetical protein